MRNAWEDMHTYVCNARKNMYTYVCNARKNMRTYMNNAREGLHIFASITQALYKHLWLAAIAPIVLPVNYKNSGKPSLLGFPLFPNNETSGIRTPDNLIKSQHISSLFKRVSLSFADILRTFYFQNLYIFTKK